jgi:hypothetical protein
MALEHRIRPKIEVIPLAPREGHHCITILEMTGQQWVSLLNIESSLQTIFVQLSRADP